MIVESSPNSFVILHSRLIIDRASTTDREYTCVGRAGSKTDHSTATIFGVTSGKKHNLTELSAFDGPKKPRIVLFYSAIFELMGSSVVLPCSIAGRPYPEVSWLDQYEELINGNGEGRVRVLPTGDLLITDLEWSDMGAYTCIARNPAGKDSISTFVYPLLVSILRNLYHSKVFNKAITVIFIQFFSRVRSNQPRCICGVATLMIIPFTYAYAN